jgi:pRiA4b ORF-3-like protein
MQSLERAQTRVKVYAIKVTLLGTRPPVWRRILVPRDITLRNLHRTLQTVMGWTDSHLHQFVFQRQSLSDPRSRVRSKVADDFGDGWQHELLLEEVLLGDESFQQICVAGKRCCPPEDCGGPHGFAELLKALQDANDPRHEKVCAWLGDFVPESFSVDETNRRLRRHRKH